MYKEQEEGARPLVILGIDPGLAEAGWGVVSKTGSRIRCVAYGSIATAAEEAQSARLLTIYREISAVIARYQPAAGAVEALYFYRNITSGIPVAEARGVLLLALAEAGVAEYDFTPAAIKLTVTGVASADKGQVQEMTRLVLGLSETPRPDHAADALAAAVACAAHLSAPGA
jgi:crossover junction endodeoxyribonuclease RuvC